jgi:hypothetical protein
VTATVLDEPNRRAAALIAIVRVMQIASVIILQPNAKLTDDEERASDARIGTCG